MERVSAPVQMTHSSKPTGQIKSLFSQYLIPMEQTPYESNQEVDVSIAELLTKLLSDTDESNPFWNPSIEDKDVQALMKDLPDEIKELIESMLGEQIKGEESIQIHLPEMKLAFLLQVMFYDQQHTLSQPQQKELTQRIGKWFPEVKLDSKDSLSKQIEQIFNRVKKVMDINGSTDKSSFIKIMEDLSTVKKVQTFAEQAFQRYVPVKQTEHVSNHFQSVQSPLSPLEQWTLKVPVSTEEGQKQPFIRELQQIITKGKLIVTESGFTKMQIKLTPENLGTIEIQLIQKHGEIAARIIASSQAAKDALDGQLTQLKQAFTGQNIEFEKLEVVFYKDDQSFPFHDQERQERENHHPNNKETDDVENEFSFEEQLSEVILNEEV